jgi:nitroreductase
VRKTAHTAVPLHPLLAERWSPRAFDATREVDDAALAALLEAARWAPSAMNSQPWRFVVGRRGDETFKRLLDTLLRGNQVWAHAAGVLVLAVAETTDAEGGTRRHAAYDTGQAVAHLTVQAQALGLATHQMAGFDADHARAVLDLPAGCEPVTAVAVGHRTDASALPETLADRERAPRERRPLPETAICADGAPLPLDPGPRATPGQ